MTDEKTEKTETKKDHRTIRIKSGGTPDTTEVFAVAEDGSEIEITGALERVEWSMSYKGGGTKLFVGPWDVEVEAVGELLEAFKREKSEAEAVQTVEILEELAGARRSVLPTRIHNEKGQLVEIEITPHAFWAMQELSKRTGNSLGTTIEDALSRQVIDAGIGADDSEVHGGN